MLQTFQPMNIYAYITPFVLILLLAEILVDYFSNKKYYNFQDSIANIGTGIGNQCVNLGVAFFVYKFYGWLHQFAPFNIPVTWYTFIILLVLQDFLFYWFHRVGHTLHIFWAAHMPHHSSEEFNLSVGIRASFTQRIFQFLFFDWVLALIGFSPDMIYAVAALHLLIAYWHHTRYIKRIGFMEKFFVTPSHHRVHHGVNPQYIDKNFSEFLIIWDKLFGTFAPEEEEVCYGVTHPPRSWNPMDINFQYWRQLWQDAVAAPKWIDKIKIWFMPLSWKPEGMKETQTDERIGYTVNEQIKFTSVQYKHSIPYLIIQVLLGLAFLFITINLKLPLEGWHRVLLSFAVFLMIISWSGFLEAKKWAIPMEIFRILFQAGSLIFVLQHSGIASWTDWLNIVILIASGLSLLLLGFLFHSKQVEGSTSALPEFMLKKQ